MPELRPYQVRGLDDLRQTLAAKGPRAILESPTGSGKTLVAASMIQSCMNKGKRALFLASRRELIHQCSRKLNDFGVPHGIIMAGENYHRYASVQVASKCTLAARGLRREVDLPQADLCVVDEAHQSMANEWLKLLKALEAQNPKMVTVGLTATPARASGKGLGSWYQSMVKMSTYKELQADGHLVKVRVYAPDTIDLNGLEPAKTSDGYNILQLEKRCMGTLVGDIVEHWKMLAPTRPTVVFACSVGHSVALKNQFVKAGIDAAHLDMSTPTAERDSIIKGVPHRWQVICNYDILTLGWDCPPISCVVNAAPSKSIVRFRQRAGRALRPFEGKRDCLLIDHTGSVYIHGFPDDDIDWPLDKHAGIDQWKARKDKERLTADGIRQCDKCWFTWRPPPPECPQCGYTRPNRAEKIAVKKGLLKRVSRASRIVATKDPEFYRTYWTHCLYTQGHKGLTCGAAAAMFSSKCGMPPWKVDCMRMLPVGDEWKRKVTDYYPTLIKGKK